MKKLILLTVILLIASCNPSRKDRTFIISRERSMCNYPLTYKSRKWEVYNDSVKTTFNAFDKKLNKWVPNYVPVKIILHKFTSKNAFGIPVETISKTIKYKDGKLEFN